MANTKDDVLTTYTFECSYGDILTEEKPIVKAKKPGIYLHFLRYGLFDRNAKIETHDVSFTEEENEMPQENKSPENEKKPNLIKLLDNNFHKFEINLKAKENPVYKETPISTTRVRKKEFIEFNHDDSVKTTELDEVKIYSLKKLPKLKNFYAHPTSLNKGYIYIFNACLLYTSPSPRD